MKVLSIVGARPQFIKVAALHRAIEKEKSLQHFILHTGQHYDDNMSKVFFKELDIPDPDFHLSSADPSIAASTTRMTEGIEKILAAESPGVVLVYGDTNSTLAGAMAAKKLDIKLAHVEAGLRSYNDSMPEEFNRIRTDKISDLLFCPTIRAVNNLLEEGANKQHGKIILSGDIMLDAINYYSGKLPANKATATKQFILCTLHRQSLVQSHEKLKEVILALNEINKLIPIKMPAHPGFKKVVKESGLHIEFNMVEPVGYLGMINFLNNCTAVITDSGGLQKEAFFCKKPCVTIRHETEWTELVTSGVNLLAGDSSAKDIMLTFNKALETNMNFPENLYGKGNCAEVITEELVKSLAVSKETD